MGGSCLAPACQNASHGQVTRVQSPRSVACADRKQSAIIDSVACLTQGGAKKRKFRGARQGLPAPDMLGDKEGVNSAHPGIEGATHFSLLLQQHDHSNAAPHFFAESACRPACHHDSMLGYVDPDHAYECCKLQDPATNTPTAAASTATAAAATVMCHDPCR